MDPGKRGSNPEEAVQGFLRRSGKSQENRWQGEGRGRGSQSYRSGSTGSLWELELEGPAAPYNVSEAMITIFFYKL